MLLEGVVYLTLDVCAHLMIFISILHCGLLLIVGMAHQLLSLSSSSHRYKNTHCLRNVWMIGLASKIQVCLVFCPCLNANVFFIAITEAGFSRFAWNSNLFYIYYTFFNVTAQQSGVLTEWLSCKSKSKKKFHFGHYGLFFGWWRPATNQSA